MRILTALVPVLLLAAGACGSSADGDARMEVTVTRLDTATFAAGCFWGVQAAFDRTPGVVRTTVGYTGGRTANPSYRQVCTGMTGHAEAVEVSFDPAKVSYDELLDVFWRIHDPTTRDRQGPDIGSQYRSAIFYHSEAQRLAALASRARLGAPGRQKRPVVTELTAAAMFWPAEEYHQKYFERRGGRVCRVN